MKTPHQEKANRNPDPITNAPGSHPLGTGVGAATGGAIAGAALGTVVGPVGTVLGAAIGAIAGGLAGHAIAENAHPTIDDATAPTDADTAVSSPSIASPEPSHDAIQRRAYQVWEGNGRFDGRALDDWIAAESDLRGHT